MSWWASLSWSHAALCMCGFLLTCTLLASWWASAHSVDLIDEPHHSARRNSTEAVP